MAKKMCSRCYFAVSSKRRSCDTCGNKTFVDEPVVIGDGQEDDGQEDVEFKHVLRSAWRGLHSELSQTSSKSVRAAKRLIDLVNQHGVHGGSR